MCVRAYVSCGHCSARADEHVRIKELRTEVVLYSVDEEGSMCDVECDYGDEVRTEEDGYHCTACGSDFTDLDQDCTDPDCDCEECQPAIDNYEDPATYIKLCRTRLVNKPAGDSISELKMLIDNRWLPHLFVTRERAEQIGDLDWSGHFYWDYDRAEPGWADMQDLILREEVAA